MLRGLESRFPHCLRRGATRRWEPAYLCSYRRTRGSTVCDNAHKALVSEADSRVIGAIEAQRLSPAAIDYAVDRALEAVVDAQQATPDRLKQIEGELGRLNRELDRFMALIAEGRAPERILGRFRIVNSGSDHLSWSGNACRR